MLGFVWVNGSLETFQYRFIWIVVRREKVGRNDLTHGRPALFHISARITWFIGRMCVLLTGCACVCSLYGHNNNNSVLATRQHSGFQLIYIYILRFFSLSFAIIFRSFLISFVCFIRSVPVIVCHNIYASHLMCGKAGRSHFSALHSGLSVPLREFHMKISAHWKVY